MASLGPTRWVAANPSGRLPTLMVLVSWFVDAVREELLEAGREAAVKTVRLGGRLRPEDSDELKRRIADLGDEFVTRDDPNGQPIGILALVHRRRP